MTELALTLPWPPSVNHYWQTSGKRRFLSPAAKTFRELVWLIASSEREANAVIWPTARLKISIEAFPPDKRKRDLDNLLKGVLDALGHARVFADDSQFDVIEIVRRHSTVGGALVVVISEVEP